MGIIYVFSIFSVSTHYISLHINLKSKKGIISLQKKTIIKTLYTHNKALYVNLIPSQIQRDVFRLDMHTLSLSHPSRKNEESVCFWPSENQKNTL